MGKKYYAMLPNLIVPLAGFGTDIYVPSLPHMTKDFSVTDAKIQLTIGCYVLAMGLGQLLAGPVSDAWGRRRPIILSLLAQLIAVVIIIMAPTVEWIIGARFIQGLSVAFMIVPGRAILNDCFQGDDLKKKFNYLTISFALAPIIAPFIGGYCEYYFGWRASFYFILCYITLLLALISFTFKETIKEKQDLSIKQTLANYGYILKAKNFILSTVFLSLMFSYTSFFSVLGPFIFQKTFALSAIIYGYIALSIGFAWFAGNVTNRILFDVPTHKKVLVALITQSLMIGAMLITSLSIGNTVWTTIIPIFLMVYAAAVIFPIYVSECLSLFPQFAASSNALLFSLTWVAFALYTIMATIIPTHTLLPLAKAYLFFNVSAYIVYIYVHKQEVSE